MIRRQTLLQYIQPALNQRLGLGVLALGVVEPRQVVEALRDIGMLGAEGFFADRQRALIQRLGLGVLALGIVEQRQVVEAGRDSGMNGAMGTDRTRTFWSVIVIIAALESIWL